MNLLPESKVRRGGGGAAAAAATAES